MKRSKLSSKRSKAMFTKGASRTNGRNVRTAVPMRGGIRM